MGSTSQFDCSLVMSFPPLSNTFNQEDWGVPATMTYIDQISEELIANLCEVIQQDITNIPQHDEGIHPSL